MHPIRLIALISVWMSMSACKHILPRRFDSSAETQDAFSQQPATPDSDTQPAQTATVQAPPKQAKLRVRRISKDEAKRRMGPRWKADTLSTRQVQKRLIGKGPREEEFYEYRIPMPDGSFRQVRDYFEPDGSSSDDPYFGYVHTVSSISRFSTQKGEVYVVAMFSDHTQLVFHRGGYRKIFYTGGPQEGVEIFNMPLEVSSQGVLIAFSDGTLMLIDLGTAQVLRADEEWQSVLGENPISFQHRMGPIYRDYTIHYVVDNPRACIIHLPETEAFEMYPVNEEQRIVPELYLLVEW